jgi:hypothetical protein
MRNFEHGWLVRWHPYLVFLSLVTHLEDTRVFKKKIIKYTGVKCQGKLREEEITEVT